MKDPKRDHNFDKHPYKPSGPMDFEGSFKGDIGPYIALHWPKGPFQSAGCFTAGFGSLLEVSSLRSLPKGSKGGACQKVQVALYSRYIGLEVRI